MPKIRDLLAEPRKPIEKPVLLTTEEFAEYIGNCPSTIYRWRLRGTGPKYIKTTHSTLRYRLDDINEWMQSRELTSTSDKGGAR